MNIPVVAEMVLARVPWDPSYRDIVDWPSQRDMWDWCRSRGDSIPIPRAWPSVPGTPVNLDVPLEKAQQYNYLIVKVPPLNPAGGSTKYYAYFILESAYVAPSVTAFRLQLDVWGTWGCGGQFKMQSAFLLQGHFVPANKAKWREYGREWLTIPEGLSVGEQHQIVEQGRVGIANTLQNQILVWSSVKLDQDPGTIQNPGKDTAEPSIIEGSPGGLCGYIFPNPRIWVAAATQMRGYSWLTSGIQAIMAVAPDWISNAETKEVSVGGQRAWKIIESKRGRNKTIRLIDNIRDTIRKALPERYRHVDKMCCSPVAWIEITTLQGTPILLRPELFLRQSCDVTEYVHVAFPGPKIVYAPQEYNSSERRSHSVAVTVKDSDGVERPLLTDGEDTAVATAFVSLPQYTTVVDGRSLALASQAHRLAYQRESAQVARTQAMDTAAVGAENIGTGLTATGRQTALSAATSTRLAEMGAANNILGATLSGASGVVAGGVAGGPAGAGMALLGGASGIAGAAINAAQQMAVVGVQNSARFASTAINSEAAMETRDRNYALAERTADRNYALAVGAINAAVQDAALTPNTIAGQSGGEGFSLACQGWWLEWRIRLAEPSALAAYGDYLLRYGYSARRYVRLQHVPLSLMTHFTYWRMTDTRATISSTANIDIQNAIRGIFEQGVTVWRKAEYIPDMDIYANRVVVEVDA